MSRPPQRSGRKRSRGTASLGASTTILRSGLGSGSGLILRRRRMRGAWGSRSRDDGSSGRNYDNEENDNDGNIGENGEDGDYGVGGRRVSRNCNGSIGREEWGVRRGGKRLIPIPAALANSPLLSLPLFSPASAPASTFSTTNEAGEGGGGGSIVPVERESRSYASLSPRGALRSATVLTMGTLT